MFLFPFHSTICFTLLLVDIFSCSYLLCVAPPPLFHTHTLFFKIYLCVQDSHIMEVGNQLFHVLFSQTTRRKKKQLLCPVPAILRFSTVICYIFACYVIADSPLKTTTAHPACSISPSFRESPLQVL